MWDTTFVFVCILVKHSNPSGSFVPSPKARNLLNGYVATAMELNAQTKHCLAKCKK